MATAFDHEAEAPRLRRPTATRRRSSPIPFLPLPPPTYGPAFSTSLVRLHPPHGPCPRHPLSETYIIGIPSLYESHDPDNEAPNDLTSMVAPANPDNEMFLMVTIAMQAAQNQFMERPTYQNDRMYRAIWGIWWYLQRYGLHAPRMFQRNGWDIPTPLSMVSSAASLGPGAGQSVQVVAPRRQDHPPPIFIDYNDYPAGTASHPHYDDPTTRSARQEMVARAQIQQTLDRQMQQFMLRFRSVVMEALDMLGPTDTPAAVQVDQGTVDAGADERSA